MIFCEQSLKLFEQLVFTSCQLIYDTRHTMNARRRCPVRFFPVYAVEFECVLGYFEKVIFEKNDGCFGLRLKYLDFTENVLFFRAIYCGHFQLKVFVTYCM